ncbi:MAG: hypothetical protein ACREIP_03010 [Alphaproteobacteria bacterium]
MRLRLPILLLIVSLAGCSDSVPTLAFSEVCKKENDGKAVATDGYLRAPFAALCRSTKRRNVSTTACSFDLRDQPEGEARLSLNIESGEGANRVDKTRHAAKQGAAAIADKDGKFLAEKARVRVTGAVHAVPNSLKPEETLCWMDVDKIERR